MSRVLEHLGPASVHPPDDDRLLIGAFVAGAPQAVATVDRWIDVVLQAELHRQRQHWEDLRQEIRMRVLVNLRRGRFRGDSELRTYVHRIARNTIIDAMRRAGVRRAATDAGAPAAADRTASEQERLISRDLLDKILLELSGADRELLGLVFVEHLAYSEVARRLRVAEGTVKARVFRCRERLAAVRRRLLEIGDA
jgi:RNA polymerase sigma-70 factor (ECF subfamily)